MDAVSPKVKSITRRNISIKAIRQTGRYTKEEPQEREEHLKRQSPWWTSKNAAKRAKEALEHERLRKKLDGKKADVKAKALRNTLSTAFAKNVLPPPKDEDEISSSSSYETPIVKENSANQKKGKKSTPQG